MTKEFVGFGNKGTHLILIVQLVVGGRHNEEQNQEILLIIQDGIFGGRMCKSTEVVQEFQLIFRMWETEVKWSMALFKSQ
jgi:hypothetical protein